jgi:predicted DNA-binding transcriptional regulator AlpA
VTSAATATDRPTLDEIRRWPAAVSIPKASTAYGFSRSHGFDLANRGEFPAKLIKAGGRWLCVTADLIRTLSVGEPDNGLGDG